MCQVKSCRLYKQFDENSFIFYIVTDIFEGMKILSYACAVSLSFSSKYFPFLFYVMSCLCSMIFHPISDLSHV